MPILIVDYEQSKDKTIKKESSFSDGLSLFWYIEEGTQSYQMTSTAPSGSIHVPQEEEVLKIGQNLIYNIRIDTSSWVWNGDLAVEIVLNGDAVGVKTDIESHFSQRRFEK